MRPATDGVLMGWANGGASVERMALMVLTDGGVFIQPVMGLRSRMVIALMRDEGVREYTFKRIYSPGVNNFGILFYEEEQPVESAD